jgi:DNA-binding NtrC family response regulator
MSNALSGCRVLVIEDEVLVSWALEDMLAGLGCEVVGPAVRIGQGLALVEAGRIDAAVLDVNLNGQKSYPIADALMARGVPFAFSTGYNKDTMPEAYRDFPMLQKPYSRSKLGQILEKLLTPTELVPTIAGARVMIQRG